MTNERPVNYKRLVAEHNPSSETWDEFVRKELVGRWLNAYDAMTPWMAEVLEITQGPRTYRFIPVPAKWSHAGMDRRHFAASVVGEATRTQQNTPVLQ